MAYLFYFSFLAILVSVCLLLVQGFMVWLAQGKERREVLTLMLISLVFFVAGFVMTCFFHYDLSDKTREVIVAVCLCMNYLTSASQMIMHHGVWRRFKTIFMPEPQYGYYSGYSSDEEDQEHRSYSTSHSRSEEYRPDEWRKDIPYSDPWDSHIDNNVPNSLDRDGDGYVDGSVGDSGLF